MLDRNIPLLAETKEILKARRKWQFNGTIRPPFAASPIPGGESVWDFPRPPLIQPVSGHLEVRHHDILFASTVSAKRVLETAGAPTYYFPPDDVLVDLASSVNGASICEWKGMAETLMFKGLEVGWRYIKMFPEYESLYQWVSFYPGKVDCFVDNERARPQPGGYYGGWVTSRLAGPTKGEPGSENW